MNELEKLFDAQDRRNPRVRLGVDLRTPDPATARRRWFLEIGRKSFRLPVSYEADNSFCVGLEKKLEQMYPQRVYVGY